MSNTTKVIIVAIIAATIIIASLIIFGKGPSTRNPLADLSSLELHQICIEEDIECQ